MLRNLFRKKTLSQLSHDNDDSPPLKKTLGVRDLTAFGIAAIIGAGIFSTIGKASADGGPAVIFLFIFTAIACGFAAFSYAEFASIAPVSGSAYTYAYIAFGELVAWIIGWSLIMEYAIGNITVAISWSDYFTEMLANVKIDYWHIEGIHLPAWSTMDYWSAYKAHEQVANGLQMGKMWRNFSLASRQGFEAWEHAPRLGSVRLIADIPALAIIVLITRLVYRGIKESKNASNVMVIIKIAIILLVIATGAFYIDTANWSPFAPHGVSGVLKGISAVFFAYIGFDAISTTAEECKNPQRDLPRGMMWSILICTVLYMIIAMVLTGMVPYHQLDVGDPLAFVFGQVHLKKIATIIAIGAVLAMTSVLLIFQLGQPRIWLSMSRDGLLPKAFSNIHPSYHTPSFATVVTGFVVAIPALFMNLSMVTDLCSIGTLFAFVLVCAGVLVLQNRVGGSQKGFKTPYVNARYIIPLLFVVSIAICWFGFRKESIDFLLNKPQLVTSEKLILSLNQQDRRLLMKKIRNERGADKDIESFLSRLNPPQYRCFVLKAPINDAKKWESGWDLFQHKIPLWLFLIVSVLVCYFSFVKQLSLIPVLGLMSCLYMMSELKWSNWLGFGVWLLIGLVVYFFYGYRNSKLR